MGEKTEYGDIRNIMWCSWFSCLDDAVQRYSGGKFSAMVGHREIAERVHEIISEALFMQSGDTVSYEQIEKDLFRMLPDEAEPVMFFALREMKKAFDAEGMGITPALIREWREYKAEGLIHPRQDVAPFLIIQEAEAAVSRFQAIQRQRSKSAADRQEPEYLRQWKAKYGDKRRWSELAKMKKFRDDITEMKGEYGNKASDLLKCYWEKYPSVFGEEPATESYIKSIKYHQQITPLGLE